MSWATGTTLPVPVVDTAALSRAAGLTDTPDGYEPPLELLARQLNLPVYTPHHALGDAMTTALVFLALIARLAPHTTAPQTVRDLAVLNHRFRF